MVDSYSRVKLRSGVRCPLAAVLDEAHDQRLNDADPAVISAPSRDPVQIVEAFEDRQIRLRGLDLQAAAGIDQHPRAEIGHREGECFTEVSVARVCLTSRRGHNRKFRSFLFRSAESIRMVTGPSFTSNLHHRLKLAGLHRNRPSRARTQKVLVQRLRPAPGSGLVEAGTSALPAIGV